MKTANAMWLLLGLVWIAWVWPLLTGQVPAFRDAYHFYYPLETWLDRQAQRGDFFPQFNAHDGAGVNVVGEMSTGLFYPGRWLWWLPGLSVAQRMGVVILVHIAIAGIGAAYAARRLALGSAPQLLAATAYSLSGPVLFQHVNPIYLISAAWLPWALAESCAVARGIGANDRERWWVWILACSLMLLGGDPQATVHCGLIMVLAVGVSAWSDRAVGQLPWRLMQLALAVLAVVGITAVQTLPTWYWVQASLNTASNHVAQHAIDNVPTLLQSIQPTDYDLARGSPYAYSVAPWHLLTLLWSHAFGQFMPINSRWLSAWSAEPRMWTASLSIGLISSLLALGCLRNRELRRATGFLWLLALLSGSAMLGNYAPSWMLKSGLRIVGLSTNGLPADEVGGVYWMLVHSLPGYELFRYPAKWSPIFAASLTLCAAYALHHWHLARATVNRTLCWIAALSFSLSLIAGSLLVVPSARERFDGWLSGTPPDAWLGAIESGPAARTLWFSLTLASLVSIVAWIAMKRCTSAWQPWLLVIVLMLEMGSSNHQWLATTTPPRAAKDFLQNELLQNNLASSDQSTLTRLWAASGQANLERDRPNANSLSDKLDYQQQFMLGKLHLMTDDLGNVSSYMTLTPRALSRVRHQLAKHDRLEPINEELDAALGWLGVQSRLVRADTLQWQPVPTAAPLIEGTPSLSVTTLHVNHFSNNHVSLKVEAVNDCHLVVRLFQDGGWRANMRSDEGETIATAPTPSHLGLFQSLELPAGTWQVELHYETPGIRTGVWISALSIVALIVIGLMNQMPSRTAPSPSPQPQPPAEGR